jgi:hypothetical protein
MARSKKLAPPSVAGIEVVPPRKAGRPSDFKPEYAQLASNMAHQGMNDRQIAAALGVDDKSFYGWKYKYPVFGEILCKARNAPGAVAATLYKRARGFSKKTEKLFFDAKWGAVVRAETREYYPPDVKAILEYLKRHDPERWGDEAPGSAKPKAPIGDIGINITIDAATLALCGVTPKATAA